MNILWIGSTWAEPEMLRNPAISPAANRWQSCLTSEFAGAGHAVEFLGHQPAPAWPRGPWRFRAAEHIVRGLRCRTVGYYNLPRQLRAGSLARAYRRQFADVRASQRIDCVCSYNLTAGALAVGREAAAAGIPWISFLADSDLLPDFWNTYRSQTAAAAGHVFLSWHSFQECPLEPKFHFEGGVQPSSWPRPEARGRRLVFTGTVSSYTGIFELVLAFRHVKDATAELHVSGKGEVARLQRLAGGDPRIRLHGMLAEADLDALYRSAAFFVNPRPWNVAGNEHNFPSKILDYLAFGRPVLSTWTPGLAPVYREALIAIPATEPPAFAATLDEVFGWDAVRYAQEADRAAAFARSRTWTQRTRELLAWMERATGAEKSRGKENAK